jgi:hypothetical protein
MKYRAWQGTEKHLVNSTVQPSQGKKILFFLDGEVYSLTRGLLMGDPIFVLHLNLPFRPTPPSPVHLVKGVVEKLMKNQIQSNV